MPSAPLPPLPSQSVSDCEAPKNSRPTHSTGNGKSDHHIRHIAQRRLPSSSHNIPDMSFQTAGDLPLQITSENSSSERRITPSWTIGQLKAKLEPVTGIPPLSQKLTLRLGSQQSVPLEAADEENTQLGSFPLAPYAEIHVSYISLVSDDVSETV